ncbi:MAG: peptide-methionine (S)-S-oxide reductase MsrA [Promethearchaeota archaeon]
MHTEEANEIATLGGGCFWCLEPIFNDVQGVIKVESGYSGGYVVNPSYEAVCTGTTGHAEVVQVTFNPTIISFKEILEIFFEIHDPTTLNRQGNDIGPQYRSAIFYHSLKQKEIAESVIKELEASKTWKNPIVTELASFDVFYRAEEYHQEYFKKNPYEGYCRAIIAPKVNKFRKKYSYKLKIST